MSFRSMRPLAIVGALLLACTGCAAAEDPVVLIDSAPTTLTPPPSSPATTLNPSVDSSEAKPKPDTNTDTDPDPAKRPTVSATNQPDLKPSEIGPSGSASSTGPLDASIDGLGEARFGDDAQDTIGYFAEQFGPPTADSGWGPNQAPCENMGSRVRILSWNDEAFVFLATGPTETVQRGADHFSAFSVSRGFVGAERITISGVTVLDRSVTELQGELPGVAAFDSEIEGPVWALISDGIGSVSGSTSDGVTTSVRAGLFCID